MGFRPAFTAATRHGGDDCALGTLVALVLKYCERQARVLRRIENISDEKTGRMLTIRRDRVILDGLICRGDYHRSCPRATYTYWCEAWLNASKVRRVSGDGPSAIASCRPTGQSGPFGKHATTLLADVATASGEMAGTSSRSRKMTIPANLLCRATDEEAES